MKLLVKVLVIAALSTLVSAVAWSDGPAPGAQAPKTGQNDQSNCTASSTSTNGPATPSAPSSTTTPTVAPAAQAD